MRRLSRPLSMIPIGITLFIFLGCGGHGSTSHAPLAPAAIGVSEDSSDAAFLALGLRPLTCISEHCPPAVGQLITNSFRGLHACTASLVASDLILTASHCVPWELVSPQQGINGACWFRTPLGNRARCLRVVDASRLSGADEGEVESDYAYIEIAPSLSLAPMPVIEVWGQDEAQAGKIWVARVVGLERSAALQSLATFHEESVGAGFSSVVRELSCHREPEARLAQKTWNASRARVFSGCDVRPGDSGGPLVDDQGEIHGVLSLKQASKDDPQRTFTVVSKADPEPRANQ